MQKCHLIIHVSSFLLHYNPCYDMFLLPHQNIFPLHLWLVCLTDQGHHCHQLPWKKKWRPNESWENHDIFHTVQKTEVEGEYWLYWQSFTKQDLGVEWKSKIKNKSNRNELSVVKGVQVCITNIICLIEVKECNVEWLRGLNAAH